MNLVQTADELYLLNTISKWRSISSLEFGYEESHSYHASNLITLLNPLYLSSFKNVESLNNFSFIQCRDGLIDLLKFFLQNQNPENITTKLLIDSKLEHIVPFSWKENVIFYRNIRIKRELSAKALIFSHTYITNTFDEDELVKLISENSFENLYVYGDCSRENLSNFLEINSRIEKISNLNATYLNVDEVRSINAQDMILYEDRTCLLSSAKSYLTWELIVAGACPHNYVASDSIDYLESPFTSIEIQNKSNLKKDPKALYEWIEKNARENLLYEIYEDFQNTNNLQRPLTSQTVNFALSVLNNESLFYS
jgi:hypothetical protein